MKYFSVKVLIYVMFCKGIDMNDYFFLYIMFNIIVFCI